VIVWVLCVALQASLPQTCLSVWPTEDRCWQAAADYDREALAWSRRSGLPAGDMTKCVPLAIPP